MTTIQFIYNLHSLEILLFADVIKKERNNYYVVQNIRTAKRPHRQVLPAMKLKKKDEAWIHVESLKETYVSGVVGKAIEAVEIAV